MKQESVRDMRTIINLQIKLLLLYYKILFISRS